jgi:hypothetical protein
MGRGCFCPSFHRGDSLKTEKPLKSILRPAVQRSLRLDGDTPLLPVVPIQKSVVERP